MEPLIVPMYIQRKREGAVSVERLLLLSDCENRFFYNELRKIIPTNTLEIVCGGYNQIESYLYDETLQTPEYVVLVLTSRVLYEQYCISEHSYMQELSDWYYQRIKAIWNKLTENGVKCIIQATFSELPENVWGNYAAQEVSSFTYQIRRLNSLLLEESTKINNIRILDLQQIHLSLGNNSFYDMRLYYMAKCPFSLKAIHEICKNIKAIIQVLCGKMKKVIVCDLDGLLWGGAIAEDGLSGIQLGE